MKDWFFSLESREQRFVATAAVVIVLAIAWIGIWQPLDTRHELAAEDVATWQDALAKLRPMRSQVQAAASGAPITPGGNQSLVVTVDNSLRQRGLYGALQRSLPTPAGDGIRVEFENAAFDDLMLWLGDLHRQFGLRVDSSSFSPASGSSPGRVNASVTLQR